MGIFSGEATISFVPFINGVHFYRKEYAPVGVHTLVRVDPIFEGPGCTGEQTG